MSKFTPKLVQLLEGTDDFPLPINLQSKYQTYYSCTLYGALSSSMPLPDVETKFHFVVIVI